MDRGSGILLHITSLPSKFGIGDFGPAAYHFVDFLKDTGQKYWQILPLSPTGAITCHSPYSSYSAFALNPLFISPELLIEEGWLKDTDIRSNASFPDNLIDYSAVSVFKGYLFNFVFDKFKEKLKKDKKYQQFLTEHRYWLDDLAFYLVAKENCEYKSFSEWPEDIRDRKKEVINEFQDKFADRIEKNKFLQYLAFKQWLLLKNYARKKGVKIIGDIPIYVDHDSVDVWTHRNIFKLELNGRAQFIGGVPPDYFSKTGQRWGNPVYDWSKLKGTDYDWWVKRIEHNIKLFDFIRIDHFRGFAQYWEIPVSEPTAVNGRWVDGPRSDLFTTLKKKIPQLPIVAEDVGLITDDVRELMKEFDFPGMKLLIFAFGDDMKKNPYLPHNYEENCLVYPGTHDNNTIKGWFKTEARESEKTNIEKYLNKKVSVDDINWEFIQMAMGSKANVAVSALQDVLGLGQEARMNKPGTIEGNWQWRFEPKRTLTMQIMKDLKKLTETTNR